MFPTLNEISDYLLSKDIKVIAAYGTSEHTSLPEICDTIYLSVDSIIPESDKKYVKENFIPIMYSVKWGKPSGKFIWEIHL